MDDTRINLPINFVLHRLSELPVRGFERLSLWFAALMVVILVIICQRGKMRVRCPTFSSWLVLVLVIEKSAREETAGL